MRCTTLKASQAKLPKLLDYYAGLAEDRDRFGPGRGPVDYYLDPDEPPGQWWGAGRHALGLAGEVSGEQLRALLEATSPTTGAKLGRGFGDSSARGFDCTFSAPKSVSVLWAATPDPWVRAEVLTAHDAAVDAALAWFETHGSVTRRGTDGVFQVDTDGITAALFRQHTSRTVDPQLHTHAIISAKVQDPSGDWFSLDARFLKQQQMTIGWLYDAALRAELTTRLGVGWRANKHGRLVDLDAVPKDVCEYFSERSEQVEAKHQELIARWSTEHGGAEPDRRTIAMLQRRAVTASRPAKEHTIDALYLFEDWAEHAALAGLDVATLTADQLRTRLGHQRAVDEEALIVEALSRVQDETATFLRADVVRHITNLAPAASADELIELVDRLAERAEARCVPLGPERSGPTRRNGRPITEATTDRLFTTPTVLDQEDTLQVWAETHAVETAPHEDPQVAATEAIAGHARLVVVVGPAGTGKTTTVAEGVKKLRSQGRQVIGLAPSGKAADVLGLEAGCPTDTVAGFLTRQQHSRTGWPPGTTVILDEAAMTTTEDLGRLVGLAERHRWRLVAVGDPAQLPAVGRGGTFAHWCNTVPHIELETPRRFRDPWEAEASLLLRSGHPEAAERYAEHGRLSTIHPAVLPLEVARTHKRFASAGRSVAITTNTTATARSINQAIQHQRRVERPVRLADGTAVGVGDQIATRRNDRTLRTERDEQVRNRHTWTVTATRRDGGLTVEHPERGTLNLPATFVAEHVELGWAVTSYGNQGDTVDIGIAVLESGTSRAHAYVAMTRGRDLNLAVIPDPTGTTDAAEALTQMIARTPRHESALATRARLHAEAGIPGPPLELAAAGTSVEPESSGPTLDPDLVARADSIRRQLDAIQHKARDRQGPSLGL
jgi:conjugative relaxase-like TrwC/TraI family protein